MLGLGDALPAALAGRRVADQGDRPLASLSGGAEAAMGRLVACHAIDSGRHRLTIPITIACPAVQSSKVYPSI